MIQGESLELFLNTMAQSMMAYAVLISSEDASTYFSGTIIAHSEDAFVLTAKHCLKELDISKRIRIVSNSFSSGILVPSPKHCYLEDVDLGLIYVSPEHIDLLKVSPRNINTFNSNTASPGKEVYFFGFPFSIANVKGNVLHPTPLYYRSVVSERWPGKDEFEGHSEKNTFFLEWDESNTVDTSNTIMPAIKLPGISGAGVFVTKTLNDTSTFWDFTDLQLAGVVSSVNRSARLIRCTRAEYGLKFFGATIDIKSTLTGEVEYDI